MGICAIVNRVLYLVEISLLWNDCVGEELKKKFRDRLDRDKKKKKKKIKCKRKKEKTKISAILFVSMKEIVSLAG